jgi:hypothetical protein
VWRHRPRTRLLRLTAVLAAPAMYATVIRPRMLIWGATTEEATATYPGDELVTDTDGGATTATTLPVPLEEVWPWLVQMGGERAGWYSWDCLDNGGEPSADRIVSEWQNLQLGQHLRRPPKSPTNWWTVVVLEPNRTMVLQTSYGPTGRSFDPQTGHVPWSYTEGIWGFHLRAAPEGGTRLVVRTRNRSPPRLLNRPLTVLVGEPVHFFMQARQFHNLRTRMGARRAEGHPSTEYRAARADVEPNAAADRRSLALMWWRRRSRALPNLGNLVAGGSQGLGPSALWTEGDLWSDEYG